MATAFSPQERERIRESLLDAALKSAASQGMRHATVDELAREAGISKGAFYRFYQSKEHLFLSMLERTHEEMYGEPFVIPNPDEVVFISWFQGGNVFRSGVTFHRGTGKIFYFQPGHETYRSYYNENVLKVIHNAIKWAYNPEPANIPCVWENKSRIPFTVDESLGGLTHHPDPVK